MAMREYKRNSSLLPGMIIDQAIVDRAGRVLIARRTKLDDYLINAIRKMGIPGIYICDGEEKEENGIIKEAKAVEPAIQKQILNLSVEDPIKVKLSESVKKQVAEGLQFLYSDTESVDFEKTTKAIAKDLMSAIVENDAIAVDINELKICDEYTFKHSLDVATMSMIIGKRCGFSEKEIHDIGISGLLHDIGKAKIPAEILNKAEKLTDQEFEIMKQHSLMGYGILKGKGELSDEIKRGVLQHHEKIDGSGYPMGVTGEKISLFAKIISVVDIYDALVTERPYKKAYTPRDAVEMIMSMTSELDIYVMKRFMESIILYPVGSDVMLSNGEMARVVENNNITKLRPKVIGLNTGRIYDLATDMKCANIVIV